MTNLTNNDIFLQHLLSNKAYVRTAMFHYVGRCVFTAPGQQQEIGIQIPGNDFLLRDIEIHAYDKFGSLYGIGFAPRDRFSFMMQNVTSGENFFSRTTDVMNFSPLVAEKNRIVPDILPINSHLSFKIYHEPIQRNAGINDQALDFSVDGGVHFEIVLKGAKLYEDPKARRN